MTWVATPPDHVDQSSAQETAGPAIAVFQSVNAVVPRLAGRMQVSPRSRPEDVIFQHIKIIIRVEVSLNAKGLTVLLSHIPHQTMIFSAP